MAREERRAKEQSSSLTPQARRNQQHSQASGNRKVVKKPGAPSKLPRLRAAAVGRAMPQEIERLDRGQADRDTLPDRA